MRGNLHGKCQLEDMSMEGKKEEKKRDNKDKCEDGVGLGWVVVFSGNTGKGCIGLRKVE
jgi:hypothetical protein